MGKALLIKNVDFSENKLDTVTFTDPVPCTAISISDSTAALQKVGSTKTLTATVMPLNTTDSIVWTSSNENIATVGAGVVTQTGVGTVTITATCGEQSASCVITCTHVIDCATELLRINNAAAVGASNNGDYLRYVESSASTGYIQYLDQINRTGGYQAIDVASSHSYYNKYGIVIPKNTTKATLTSPADGVGYMKYAGFFILDSKTQSANASNVCAKRLYSVGSNLNASSGSVEFNIAENIGDGDQLVFFFWTGSTSSSPARDATGFSDSVLTFH